MTRLVIIGAVALAACSSKKKQPKEVDASGIAASIDAAAKTPEPDKPAEPPVPAIGKTDAEAAKQIAASYKALRSLFAKTAEDEVKLSAAQQKALVEVAGKAGLARAKETANDAGWGETATRVWLERLAKDARSDLKSIVRLPLWQCVGWGSATPSDFVAAGCFTAAVFFVHPVGEAELIDRCGACSAMADDKVDECRDKRCFLAAEGYFTGAVHQTKGGPPGEPGPVAYEFHIQRARVDKKARPTLRLPGGSGPADGPAITAGPKWGVMYANAFATDPAAAARAADQATRLKAAGFDAEVVDSRRIPELWCCSQAVLIGRFETRQQAQAKAKAITKAGLPRPIVRELY